MARSYAAPGSVRPFLALAAISAAPFVFAQSIPPDFTTGYRYDIGNRLTGIILPDPDGGGPLTHLATRFTYNIAGLLSAVEEGELAAWQPETVAPANWNAFTVNKLIESSYDSAGRKLWERTSAGGVAFALTQYSYDVVGRLECTAVRLSPTTFGSPVTPACSLTSQAPDNPDRITRIAYDARDRVLTAQNAYGTSLQQSSVTYTYAVNGARMPQTVTDAAGNKHQTDYDGFDQLKRWTFPSKTTPGQVNSADYLEYTVDQNGNRLSLRRRDGRILNYQYDDLNRVVFKDVPASTGADVYYNYDLQNHLLDARFQSPGGRGIHNAFDGFGLLRSSSINLDDPTWMVRSDYDANGNRTRVVHPDGKDFQYAYDGIDRLVGITENATGGTLVVQTYNAQGRRSHLIRGGGVATTSYMYDGLSRLQSLTHNLDATGTANDVTFSFPAYNAASQVTSRSTSNAAYEFATTSANTRAYAPNGLNQYASVAGTAFIWSADGNLEYDGSTAFGYDIDNRLISASGTMNTALTYDPLGRMYKDLASSTRFVYEGDDLIAEYGSAGQVSNRYVHGSGADEPLVWYQTDQVSSTTRRYVYADFQGSTVALTNAAGAMLGSPYKYDSYGNPNSTNGTFRFQYTGQAQLPSLGLSYYKARFYNAGLGRFMQTDPIGFHDGLNLYSYVGNDPTTYVDPSGTQAWLVFARPTPMVNPSLQNSLRVSPEPIPPTTVAEAVGRTLAEAAQRPAAKPEPGDLTKLPGESADAFGRRVTGNPESGKLRPEIGYEPVRRGGHEDPWWVQLIHHAKSLWDWSGTPGGAVVIRPVSAEGEFEEPVPSTPHVPEPDDEEEHTCEELHGKDRCMA